jgi:hypothetical protein
MNTARAAIESPLLTKDEAAAYCRVSVKVFDKKVRPWLPRIRIGRLERYERTDVEAFIRNGPPKAIGHDKRTADSIALDRTMAAAASRDVGFVYFISGAHGTIKIGKANDVAARLRTLRASSPVELRLLGTIRAGRSAEAALHRRFAKSRLHGEWFRSSAELLALIAGVCEANR